MNPLLSPPIPASGITTVPKEALKTISIKGRKIVSMVTVQRDPHSCTIALATIPKDVEVQWEFAFVSDVDKPVNKSPTSRE